MVKAYIVLGSAYGDEGKGLVTDYLCGQSERPLVVRFNGGQQAGHTVVTSTGKRHVFSNFGSGSFRNVPTYWSAYCCFSPFHFLDEYERLGFLPKVLLDENCMVTTHYDMLFNQALEASRGNDRYGSCGMGVGATMDRSKQAELALRVKDCRSPELLQSKLQLIREYFRLRFEQETIYDFDQFTHDQQDESFLTEVFRSLELVTLTNAEQVFTSQQWQTLIFEGAQGIMLDQTFGTQPYITKSNTTSKNAIELLAQQNCQTEIYYITRCYATRHGTGPFSRSNEPLKLVNNANETNIDNPNQGQFRIAPIDEERLRHALRIDERFSGNIPKNLVITCLDQFVPVFDHDNLIKSLNRNFNRVLGSYGPTADDIVQLY